MQDLFQCYQVEIVIIYQKHHGQVIICQILNRDYVFSAEHLSLVLPWDPLKLTELEHPTQGRLQHPTLQVSLLDLPVIVHHTTMDVDVPAEDDLVLPAV